MHIDTVPEPPVVETPVVGTHERGKYGPFIKALRAHKEGWLRIAHAEMPWLANDPCRRTALLQVARRYGFPLDTQMDERYIYVRHHLAPPPSGLGL
jgi:hypothetical protein